MFSVNLLVVDPDAQARQLNAAELAAQGFVVTTAHDGAHAMTCATPDVALVELTLPDMAGIDLIRRLKAAAVHVIVVTERQEDGLRAAAFDAGTDDYVVKPAPPGELARRVHAAAQGSVAHDIERQLAIALAQVRAGATDHAVRSLERMSGLVAKLPR